MYVNLVFKVLWYFELCVSWWYSTDIFTF